MATVTPNYNWPVPTSTDYVADGAVAIEALGDAIDASVYNKIYAATRQLAANNGFTNQTSFGDMTNAADKTALDMSIVKKQNSSLLVVNFHFPVWLFSGAAQNFYGAVNIGGTDYALAGGYITTASSTGFMSGTRIISGINAGTYATKPRFASGGASTFIAASLSYVSYSIQELPQ